MEEPPVKPPSPNSDLNPTKPLIPPTPAGPTGAGGHVKWHLGDAVSQLQMWETPRINQLISPADKFREREREKASN